MKNCGPILMPDRQPVHKGFIASKTKTVLCGFQKTFLPFVFLFSFIALSANASAQLGVYSFTGTGNCPNQNPAVTSQPANASFSTYTNVNASCDQANDVFQFKNWNQNNTIDLTQYNQFTVTPNAGYALTLSSFSFTQSTDQDPNSGTTNWVLRSSTDNYATDIATGSATTTPQTPVVALPSVSFTNIGAVTFRIYILNAHGGGTRWTNDDVTLNGSVIGAAAVPADPANPVSNSPQCSNPGVTITASGTPPSGISWYWQTSVAGTSTANASSSQTVTTAGTYYIRAQDNTSLAWSNGAGSITVVITPDVTIPVFSLGATSARCQGAGTVSYTATATNNTGIIYSLDAASITGGNTINSSTGDVSYAAGWSGVSVITASAAGCGGPKTTIHTVTVTASVVTPVFSLGSASTRCQGAGTVTYTATAANNTGIVYSLDAASITGGNSINSSTGAVIYAAGWSGTSTITVSAAGCNAPRTATHVVTVTPTVFTPVFSLGATSVRCQGAGTVSYTATATNNTAITYSLDAASITGGNNINSSTGDVTYAAGWSGASTITATAAGCNGPKTATHTVTITNSIGTPVFTLGAASTRCQGAGSVSYTATASASTGLSYALDAASITGGNSINAATGVVTYAAGWSGTSTITATATGCNGPTTANHLVTITPTVATPSFTLGVTSTRCQGAGTVTYTATATNNTGITYSFDAASITGGNSINSATGVVTYVAGWSGTSTITSSATGCNGPKTTTHVVTITPTVGTPVFILGATSTRCQAAGTVTYTATATNNTGITYSLDATSTTGGNTINAATGDVTYVAGWSGTSIITASATGCNGPKTATHSVTTNQPVTSPVFSLGATTIRCQGAGIVTYTATATNTTGITYSLDAPSITGGNSINSSTGALTYSTGWSGTSTITASAAGCGGPLTATHVVTITPTVGTPVFALGATSTRCQGAGTVTYTATSTNTTGITYSLDAASITGGNTINSSTGNVTYVAGWTGTSTITASSAGCNGPKTATHVVTVTPTVGTPVFTLGASSIRCLGGSSVTYMATATNTTGITYSLDALSLVGLNTINSSTGAVTYSAIWIGSSVITATAAGCNGPSTATHTVTINAAVTTPVFTSGATSTRCQGAGSVTYTATASNTSGITYSLDAASLTGGNAINSSTGAVTYAANWSGTSTITTSAAGCNGPKTATHIVTITPTVGTPVFALGSTSARCQGAATVTYTATATNTTGITYSLDAASITGGNTINSATGDVTYVAGWTGTSTITATAAGCNGPKTANHTVTINITVVTPVFTLGATTTRCQGAGTVSYAATATNSTGITYSLDAASITGGNSINSSTGVVTYAASWTGTSTITTSAAGCSGPKTATHVVTITPTVSTPVFALGATTTRCQGAASVTYTATSTNTTGITYSLDAASITGGNSINSSTGAVTYVAGWSGASTITATAAGCNGPKTATHIVTVTPTVGLPVFTMGLASIRTQGAGAVTYTATATNSTGKTYTLDAASISGGNTINAATGAVTWVAGWNGASVITVTAAGCNGPSTASHAVTTNASIALTPLYLSNSSGQSLDRIDPVSTGIATTVQTGTLASTGTTNTVFTQNPLLSSDLIIKAQTISVTLYLSIASGTMPANPAITALLKYGSTNIISLSTPVYNAGTNIITWTGTLGADVTVPAGQALALQITTAQAGVSFKIDYHSTTRPSKISLLPVSTFIDISSFDMYSAAYPAGGIRYSSLPNTVVYARAVVSSPFGYKDITGLDIKTIPSATAVAATPVDSTINSRTFEYVWTTPAIGGTYNPTVKAKEGYENIVTKSDIVDFKICSTCPPVAVNDSATGSGGAPIIVDVFANDYDPNGNINTASLSIPVQPNNGTGFVSNGKIVYLPNGSYAGRDTITYQICDNTAPTPLCSTGQVFFTINPSLIDPCADATKSHTYYLPYSETEARIALDSSTNTALASNNIRTIISLKIPYPGMVIIWDQWEDGYETNILNPSQTTTQVWGDGNPYNGIAPGYANDIIPAGGSIVLDNIMATNPRVPSNLFFDGKDKIYSSGQIAVTQVCGEPSIIGLQCMKTNVSSTAEYGTSFTIPVGQNFNSQDFRYSSLFIRAAQDSTVINIDKDNNGTFETTATINQGQVYHVNGGVLSGATVTSSAPIGVDFHFGGNDSYSSRDVPIYPASWYSNTYYSPVPTTGAGGAIKDTAVVMLYNSLNRPLVINWSSGVPSSGSINLPAKSVVRFPMVLSATAAYKFVNPTGEAFTAIEIVDSYTPGGGGNTGLEFDWSFNLIAESRLTDYATIAWAPGSTDGSRDDNPVWVTPVNNTTIYVKYNGDVVSGGSVSPCGLHYDVSYPLNALKYKKLFDLSDNDQSGLAVYTCDGTKLAAVYGEDPATAVTANPSWDVGSTIQPFCKQKLIFANDDYARTLIGQPVTIPILLNDYGFLATVDPTSVTNTGLLLPKHGTVTINPNGTILYTPNPGYTGNDTLEYNVCSTPAPIVCDNATVYIQISTCPSPINQNVISGQIFLDKNKDTTNNDGGTGFAGAKIYLYADGNCNGAIDASELKDSVTVDASGTYQFVTYPEKFVSDDFDGPGGTNTCASGSDGSAAWSSIWTDFGDLSTGFCNNSQTPANTDAEIVKDGAFTYALRLKDKNVSATRTVNLSGASYAFLSFSYRRKSATLTAGENVTVQASSDGVTFGTVYTIAGDGNTDANYITIYNQDISAYISPTTYIRFLTNNIVDDADTVYIDNVKLQFLKYPQCYITKLDATTVPAGYHTTTATQHSFTATSITTCLSPYDFGIARNNISISGNLFNDANGLTDNLVNGTAMGTVSSAAVYAYLIDTAGAVAFKTLVNSATGAYSFPLADVNTNYTLRLSVLDAPMFTTAPSTSALSSAWISVGDAYGTNNGAGAGNKTGTPTTAIAVKTGLTNITNVNFGIQRLPNSDNYFTSIAHPNLNQYITLNGGVNPPVLSGLDPEDCGSGCLLTNRTVIIDTIPNNAELYYNNVLVTNGKMISNFDPLLFKVKITSVTLGSTSVTFRYSMVDAALMKDPSPATYTLVWNMSLPADELVAVVNLNGSAATVNWSTLSEQNTNYFVLERSLDNMNFTATAGTVSAAGNSTTKKEYQRQDNISGLMQNPVIYYRVKLVDLDGKIKYSNVVALRLSQKPGVTVWPNPFHTNITISITTERETTIDINLIDVNGRTLRSSSQSAAKGIFRITISDLDQLPAGVYLLEITDKKAGTTYQKLLKNN